MLCDRWELRVGRRSLQGVCEHEESARAEDTSFREEVVHLQRAEVLVSSTHTFILRELFETFCRLSLKTDTEC